MEGWHHCFDPPKTPNVTAIRIKIMLQDLSTIEYACLSEQMAIVFLLKVALKALHEITMFCLTKYT